MRKDFCPTDLYDIKTDGWHFQYQRLHLSNSDSINSLIFINTEYFFIILILEDAERHQSNNLLSFMLHELVFFGYHSQFVSYPHSFSSDLHSFASYSHSCKILQLHVAATVRIHFVEVFSSSLLLE